MRLFTTAMIVLAALAEPCFGQPMLGAPQPPETPVALSTPKDSEALLAPATPPSAQTPLIKFGPPQGLSAQTGPAPIPAPTTSTTKTTYKSARSFVEATGPDEGFFDSLETWAPSSPVPPVENARAWAASARSGLPTMWLRAEYLHWWTKGATLPPLLTTGPAGIIPTLDQPGTVVLFGGSTGMLQQSGARFSFGMSLADERPTNASSNDGSRSVGMEMTYFFLSPRGKGIAAGSNGTPTLARPFVDIASGTPISSTQLIANATILDAPSLAGAIVASTRTQLWGFEGNILFNLIRDADTVGSRNWYLLLGYRHLNLTDDLTITEQLQQSVGATDTTLIQDRFSARNAFDGMQLGLRGERQVFGAWFVQVSGKLALGNVREQVDILGFTQNANATGSTVVNGGLLAQASNIGRYSRDRFACLPEGEAKLGYWLTRTMKAYVGYNILFLSRAVRAGDQVDLAVNSNQVPLYVGNTPQAVSGDAARPSFAYQETNFWAHGVTFGIEFNW